MELRGQDKEIGMPSSLGYNLPIRESPSKVSAASVISTGGGERRRDETGNGTTIFNSSQTLDDLHLHHYNQPHAQGRNPNPDPDSDPVPVAIVVGGATVAPISGGSNSRTPATTKKAVTVRYRECLKNHAATFGGHVVDGCGEFMPSGEEGTLEALKCAACDCHRNFHRKEIDGEPLSNAATCYHYYDRDKKNNNSSRIRIPPLQPPPPPLQHQNFQFSLPTSPLLGSIPPMMMAFGSSGGGGGATESSSEELNVFQSNAGAAPPPNPKFGSSKKRFRTKFTQEQKDRMLEFAEKVGWKILKQDEEAIQQFCAEVGVERKVLKVWMHNNKHSINKNQL